MNEEIKRIIEKPAPKKSVFGTPKKSFTYYQKIPKEDDVEEKTEPEDEEPDDEEDMAKDVKIIKEKAHVLKQKKSKNAVRLAEKPEQNDTKYIKEKVEKGDAKASERIGRTDKGDKNDNIWTYLILLLVIVAILFFIYKYTDAPVQTPSGVGNADDSSGFKTVTIYEYSDFYCPYSAAMQTTLKKIKEEYGVKVKIYQKQFPVTELHPLAKIAAEASECADDQNRFMQFHNIMFFAKRELVSSEEGIIEMGKNIDLDDFEKFKECILSHEKLQSVEDDITEGKAYGVKATPSLVIDGELLQGLQSYNVIVYTINQHLKK